MPAQHHSQHPSQPNIPTARPTTYWAAPFSHLITAEDAKCIECWNVGSVSTCDRAQPQKPKLLKDMQALQIDGQELYHVTIRDSYLR